MITIISKLPNGTLSKCTRLTINHPLLRSTRSYANKAHPKKKASLGTAYTVGAIAVVGAATIGYAAMDKDFRRWLGDNVPGADDFLCVVLQEKRSFSDSFARMGDYVKEMLKGDPAKRKSQRIEESKSYTPPRPVFPALVQDEKEVKFEEIRVQTANKIDVVKEKPKHTTDSAPKTLADLELKINQQGAHAIATYAEAVKALKAYEDEVKVLVESSVDRMDNQMFNSLKISTEKKNEVYKEAEETVKRTVAAMEEFKCLIDTLDTSATETQKSTARRNINRLLTDIRSARDAFEREKQSATITESYWRLVFDARCHFIEELEIMFPEFDINKKKMSLRPAELDLFLVHVLKHVLHYQKELQRLSTTQRHRLDQAVELARSHDKDFDVKTLLVQEEIDKERAKLTDEFNRKSSSLLLGAATITESYWRLVFDARCHFIEELEIMFPEFDINKKKMSLRPAELDLFLVHVLKHVLHYQKELQRLSTTQRHRLDQAVELARSHDKDFDVKTLLVQEEIDKERAKLTDEFNRKCLQLRQASELELRKRLKCQEMAHADHLADALALKEAELERDFQRSLDEKLAAENSKYRTQMAGMVARMTGMRNAIHERLEADKIAHQSQVLWSACQALYRAVKNSSPGVPWHEQMRPLEVELDAIQKAAAQNDELVSTVLSAIPVEARSRGVFPEGALRERFLQVERVARRVALVPREGGALPLYLLSLAQAALLSATASPIPQAELDDRPVDFAQLDTYDILQRARYWLDRGNYVQTLKYMNLLQGASRCVASQWMAEARILLETQQAAETLMAHAVASGLLHL